MKNHGATSIALTTSSAKRLNAHGSVPDDGLGTSEVRKRIGRGFRSFFDKPNDGQVFRYKGKPVDHTPELRMELRTALGKLAYALEGPKASAGAPAHGVADKAGRQNVEPGDNPNIPSGYAYLLQLVGHDIVQSASSRATTDDSRIALNNSRSVMLRLESIYNDGPEASPLLYEAGPAGVDTSRTYLRLGALDLRPLGTGNAFTCPFRDLARVDLSKATEDVGRRVANPPEPTAPVAGTGPASAPNGQAPLPDVIVGDSRNDDHAILSQLTVVFHLLHNGLAKWAGPRSDDAAEGAMRRYYFARMATTLIFRNILRQDVMRRLLHPGIYQLYSGTNPPRVFAFDGRVPLELSHGVLRVCHAMPRSHYVFNERRGFPLNEVLMMNSARRAASMPLPESWAIAWSNFFDIDTGNGGTVNLSARLRPCYNPQTQVAPLFASFDATEKPGLAYRDMLSAALAGLWSVSAMMKRLAETASEPQLAEIFSEAKLADPVYRKSALKAWLAETCLGGDLEMKEDELEALAQDPPLPFFLMFEAMNDPESRGLRLGPLGSVIVAEVIFGILNADPIVPSGGTSLPDQLGSLQESVFDEVAEKLPFPKLDTMAELIRFVSSLHKLDDAKPRFI